MRSCNATATLGMLVVLFAAAATARAQSGGDCGALANLKIVTGTPMVKLSKQLARDVA